MNFCITFALFALNFLFFQKLPILFVVLKLPAMRNFIYVLLPAFISCNNQQITTRGFGNDTSQTTNPKTKKEICWTGTLNGKTPIFLHYQVDGHVIVGAITYLNTKQKLPIQVLGTIEEDKSYRLLEFEASGNITGVITGTPAAGAFNGSWFSPETKKELDMKLLPKDTSISSPSISADPKQVFGDYHYRYGSKGYNGDFEFSEVGEGKAALHIISLTNLTSGPNIAEVEKDTIPFKGDSFTYKIPDSDSCEFKATFYKGFVSISYTRGYCSGQFGMNATIDGIYIKAN